MTQEAIEYNIKRLSFFLGYTGEMPFFRHASTDNTLTFLHNYSRLMDYFGGGKEQYALILLCSDDYEKMNNYLYTFVGYRYVEDYGSENHPNGPAIVCPGQINFQCNGYNWTVKKVKSYESIKTPTIDGRGVN